MLRTRLRWGMPVPLLLGLALIGCGGSQSEPESAGPVLLVTVDGLVPDEQALFGGALETPVLASLADAGTVWNDAWTAVPMTRPAVATYLTGRAPDRHGVVDDLFTPLPDDQPTLATLLSAAGYRTAAFPASSHLGWASGLWRGFEVVADVPYPDASPVRWFPRIRRSDETAQDVENWLDSLPAGERWFAWVHFPDPLVGQLQQQYRDLQVPRGEKSRVDHARLEETAPNPDNPDVAQAYAVGMQNLDAALGRILDRMRERKELERALVIVVGTLADQRGGEDRAPGPGFSLAPPSVEVPLLVRLPNGRPAGRGASEPVWAPDVAATVAGWAGVSLADDAEGIDLMQPVPADRTRFAWSWAPRDQMGWRPLRAVSRGERSLTLGLPGEAVPEDDELAVALRARLDPQPARIDAETSRELLAALDLEALPLDPGGRDFGPAEDWRRATQAVWLARGLYSEQKLQGGSLLLTRVDRQIDPDNLASRLDRGQLMALRKQKRAKVVLGEALARDPRNPDVLHWYAHAIWGEDLEQAERILETILPALPNDGDVLYDLACARSLAGDPERSQSFLRSSIEAGFRNWDLIENDPDLRNLRESGLFSEVLQEYR